LIQAAGIMFLTPDRRTLVLRRGPGSDHAGEWCFPGGCREEDETAAECAVRETLEECGHAVALKALRDHTRGVTAAEAPSVMLAADAPAEDGPGPSLLPGPGPSAPEVDFTTFLAPIEGPFEVALSEEHTGFAWASLDGLPQPLHPGCAIAVERLDMNELGVARAMAAGRLTSPQRYENVSLWDMRVTGTGVAYRNGIDEFVWRDPALYMNEEFLARCNGLSVIWEHPRKATLDSKEYGDRAIGSVFLPYLRPDPQEVWAIVKVYDAEADKAMAADQLSTSPAVVFRGAGKTTKIKLEDGSALLFEGEPTLLDHLAVCGQGVWDKGGEPSGIAIHDSNGDAVMADEKIEDKGAEERKEDRADADAGQKLDMLLKGLDSMNARMDAMEEERKADKARRDSEDKERADAARKDDDKGDPDEAPAEEGKPKEVVADKRKDSEKDLKHADAGRKDEDMDKVEEKADSALSGVDEVRRRIADVEKAMPRAVTDADHRALVDAQARADTIFQAFGDHAPRPLVGEDVEGYERRITGKLKGHSKKWKEINLHAIADAGTFSIIRDEVYADAMATAESPADVPTGQLREVVRPDVTGRRISTFHGEPRSWMGAFAGRSQRLTGINKHATN
jgi:8-oxo-dGTP pyrophosphatase MutT (NUDIX family)